MSQPTFLDSGTAPLRNDGKWNLLVKKLGSIQNNAASPFASNNPKRTDSIRRLQVKITRALAGKSSGG